AAGAIDRDRVVAVRQRPAQLAQVRAVGEPTRLAEQPEDLVAAPVLARHRRATGDAPDGVLGDHLVERAHVAAGERLEHAADVRARVYRSRGAIVRPWSSSCEW